jgi:hypothetical protein
MSVGWNYKCSIMVLWMLDLARIICCDEFCYGNSKDTI